MWYIFKSSIYLDIYKEKPAHKIPKKKKQQSTLTKTNRKPLRNNFPHSYSYSDEFSAQMNFI